MAESYGGERRRHPRINVPFPATVEGVNGEGLPFRFDTALDDLSRGGLSLRILELVAVGAELRVTARLSVVGSKGVAFTLEGKVVRVEPKPGGAYCVALKIDGHDLI